MCILFTAYRSHPDYPLIVAANRDEFYARPTKDAHFWEDERDVLAGRDLEQLGTWLGITKTGRFAALTNFRNLEEKRENKQSRGHIVKNFLTSETTPQEYLQNLQLERNDYPGFNVLVADQQSFYYYSNVENEIKEITAGVHGLSNHLLNTPWPKVERGKQQLRSLIENNKIESDALFQLLADKKQAPLKLLPNTGLSLEMEKQVSSIFIETNGYGTRCSTVLTIDKNGTVTFQEQSFPSLREKHFQFNINKASRL